MEVYEKIKTDLIIFGIVYVILSLLVHYYGLGIDNTDKDKWTRSGLKLYKDYGTSIEYIGNGNTLIRREYK